jgi:hypothetical protein
MSKCNMPSLSSTTDCYAARNKKSRRGGIPEGFRRVGLLFNEPPGLSGCALISHPKTVQVASKSRLQRATPNSSTRIQQCKGSSQRGSGSPAPLSAGLIPAEGPPFSRRSSPIPAGFPPALDSRLRWIPACAGMTILRGSDDPARE